MKDPITALGNRLGMDDYQQEHTADEVYAHVTWLEERARAEGRRDAVLDFAARVAAWLRTPEAVDEFCDSGANYNDEIDWCAAQILAASRGERTLP